MPSDTYLSAGWVGFGLMLLSFFSVVGVSGYLWYKSTPKNYKNFWKKQYWRRLMFFLAAWIPSFFAIFMFIALVADSSKIWILRITNTFPVGFTSCDESLANRGICGTPYLPLFLGISLIVCNVLWGQFMRLKMWFSVVHVLCGALVLVGSTMFELVSDGESQWIWIGVSALGAFCGWGIHVYSAFESMWYGKDGSAVITENYQSTRETAGDIIMDPLFSSLPRNTGPLTRGPASNSVNYMPFSTAEGWINFFFGILLNFGVMITLFEFIGPAGMKQYTMGIQLWIFVAIAVIFTFIAVTFQILWWSLKSLDEIHAIGTKNK